MPIFARVTAFSFVVFVVFIPKVYSEQSLIKDTSPISEMPQLDAVESMLRNYQAKLMRSSSSRINSNGPPVWIGASPPVGLPDDSEFLVTQNTSKNYRSHDSQLSHSLRAHRLVRSHYEPLSEENCKTNRYWKQINETRDIYGHDVYVVHTSEFRQFAYVYECIAQGESCRGIVEQWQSSCEMRSGWANMLHLKVSSLNGKPQWGYVAVPHHCACRIYPRVNPFVP